MASPDVPGRVEAALPLSQKIPGLRGIRVYRLPVEESMACVVHHAALRPSVRLTRAWVAAINDYRSAGPAEAPAYQRRGDQNQFITEIQFSMNHIRKEEDTYGTQDRQLDAFRSSECLTWARMKIVRSHRCG
jgi:hypothetical protein